MTSIYTRRRDRGDLGRRPRRDASLHRLVVDTAIHAAERAKFERERRVGYVALARAIVGEAAW